MNVIPYLFKQFLGKEAQKNELTLQYWDIYIPNGTVAAIRGEFTKITEIHVLELGLSISQTGSKVFETTGYARYRVKPLIEGDEPKLLKTVIISKNSEAGKALLWLKDCFKNKKVEETKLKQLFDIPL